MTDPESIQTRRKRVLYRARHRGTQELDIMVGQYAAAHVDSFDSSMLDRLEALMNHEETDLQAWLMGQRDIPEEADRDLIAAIREFRIARALS